MASPFSRNPSAASRWGKHLSELDKQLQILSNADSVNSDDLSDEGFESRIQAGHLIRQSLLEEQHANDSFRQLNGFSVLLESLEQFTIFQKDAKLQQDRNLDEIKVVDVLFSVLTAALTEHRGNQRFFRTRVDGGGWESLREKLGLIIRASNAIDRCEMSKRIFGCLLACAVDDESVKALFHLVAREKSTDLQPIEPDTHSTDEDIARHDTLRKSLGNRPLLQHPEALVVIFKLWMGMQDASDDTGHSDSIPFCEIRSVIQYIAQSCTHNLISLHGTSFLSDLLPSLLRPQSEPSLLAQFQDLSALLLDLGITRLEDAAFLYRNARLSPSIAELLFRALRASPPSSFFHFDLSLCGFSSIELPDIGRSFPPVAPSNGYTLSLWLYIVQFDSSAHTTLFGAFDSSQACFVLVYLEKDSHNLILQTSITSSRPSVRFKAVSFGERRWYHISIVHRRPKTTSSSRASLFVDGNFIEQVKSNYPLAPPSIKSQPETSNSSAPHRRSNAVQAFLGTPQDLASRLGQGVDLNQWRLASAHLFGDTLSDDLIAVHYELGLRYYGNYQDCLGSFNTYQAAASLKLRHDNLHAGRDQGSDIISAMETGASELLPESKIILALSPYNVLGEDDLESINGAELSGALSKAAARTLKGLSRNGRNALVINGAVPFLNEALINPYGFAVLTGGPDVLVTQQLDDAAWRVGGCTAVLLDILENSNNEASIVRALECVFESVRDNWRNSEAIERDNGFAILGNILANKLETQYSIGNGNGTSSTPDEGNFESLAQFPLRILSVLLKFLGYRADKPEDSVLNNPLAYRVLLVDSDFWRTTPDPVQKLYYDQFSTFGVRSKYRHFNLKRLARMRIIRKWLEALKADTFEPKIFEHFQNAFKSMLAANLTAEHLRSFSMYITYAAHSCRERYSDEIAAKSDPVRPGNASTPGRRCTIPKSPRSPVMLTNDHSNKVTLSQTMIRMLEIYVDLLCSPGDTVNIRKFAKTVTNKWLLHLLADDEPQVIQLASKILARLLIVNGPSYVQKFTEKSHGMIIMRHHLQRCWNVEANWWICFAILFGRDIATINFARPFDLFNLLEEFAPDGKCKVRYPEILPVILGMLQQGLRNTYRDSPDPGSPSAQDNQAPKLRSSSQRFDNLQHSSNSMDPPERVASIRSVTTLHIVARFLADLHLKSPDYRDFTVASGYIQGLLVALYPIVVSADIVDPETELHSRDSLLTFDGHDVMIRPLSASTRTSGGPIIRTASAEPSPNATRLRIPAPRRMSSYVVITPDRSPSEQTYPKPQSPASRRRFSNAVILNSNSIVEELLEIVVAVYTDQIFSRKDFLGLGLFMKVPPGFQEHQAYFESFILRNTVNHLGNTIKLDQKLLWEPRVLNNLQRLAGHLGEAIFEGWFIDGAEMVLDFLGSILEYLHIPDIQKMKSVRLCAHIISTIREVLLRVVLLKLSELDELIQPSETAAFLEKLVYWQTVLLATDDSHKHFLKMFCFLLYAKLVSTVHLVRVSAADLWRMLLVQKPEETSQIFSQAAAKESDHFTRGFSKLMELDNESFLSWTDDNREGLDEIFSGALSKTWEDFVAEENRNTEEAAKARISKRKEKLVHWMADGHAEADVLRRHKISSNHWRSNIHSSEYLKKQRAMQDYQNNLSFTQTAWNKLKQGLQQPCGLLDASSPLKWQLDQTEGRNRMRMRFIIDNSSHINDYQPKRRQSQGPTRHRHTITSRRKTMSKEKSPVPSSSKHSPAAQSQSRIADENSKPVEGETENEEVQSEDEFEIIEDRRADGEDFEDKNRKVLRSLHRDDHVQHVHNVSRIIGLEGSEGLLILGKNHLYLLDGLFQRSDNEVVNVWQAPQDERDPYLQMIAGREPGERSQTTPKPDEEVRSWRRDEILSVSKRRFLFRDVAIEIFFIDGRSYLLTTNNSSLRNDLYQKLVSRLSAASEGGSTAGPEESWRFDSIQNIDEQSQTLGSRFTSVFAQSHSNPATRKWTNGEISNFHYLMVINTMAGRTFNDLTQYPVFPWVLADYTSQELDLSDPRSFRDLTKPMGCQTPERQADFRDRYQSFAEMGDHNAPPFHYGTHYSTAMIVTSYLVRLQPFVQSYLLLQGGSFDHPDRLFYSIQKAWESSSRENMTDVRELIPEFFYLPEFLLNQNQFDFGDRQGGGGAVDAVILPPWAKGDPKVFIAKHREALESEYVSQNLHHWIDLIFGHKQRGEAALEATNVFHHLSYRGAKDLDKIEDQVERLATIGIIHNFGQTPHQIFQRSHPVRETTRHKAKKLDTSAENLTRVPSHVFEINNRVTSLQYSARFDRLLCSGPFKLNIGPTFDKYMEWGYVDGGVRFYSADSKKILGLFEHVHVGQLSCAIFADSKTLITAGIDCTISIWGLTSDARSVELKPRGCLFGHRTAVKTLTVSRSFSAILSGAEDGQVILWDLNRSQVVRNLGRGKSLSCARIHDVNGTIMICRGPDLSLFTLNGDPILEQSLGKEEDNITSCAFYEGAGNEYLQRDLIFTGHRRGVVNIWNLAIRGGVFVLEHIKRMHHLDSVGYNVGSAMTAVLPLANRVYTGDEDGRVYEWDCVQRQR